MIVKQARKDLYKEKKFRKGKWIVSRFEVMR
jgi:hypothetical protein